MHFRFVKPGDRVSQFDEICEVQSDKASVSITSRYDGVIKSLHFKVDDVAMVGAALLDIEVEDETTEDENTATDANNNESTDQAISTSNQEESTTDNVRPAEVENNRLENTRERDNVDKVLTTPAVRRIAAENNIRLTDVKPTGKDGRILKEDMLIYLQNISTPSRVKEQVSKVSGTSVTGKTIGLRGYSRHMWKTMTKSLVSPWPE